MVAALRRIALAHFFAFIWEKTFERSGSTVSVASGPGLGAAKPVEDGQPRLRLRRLAVSDQAEIAAPSPSRRGHPCWKLGVASGPLLGFRLALHLILASCSQRPTGARNLEC
jgi:hypothetical protein